VYFYFYSIFFFPSREIWFQLSLSLSPCCARYIAKPTRVRVQCVCFSSSINTHTHTYHLNLNIYISIRKKKRESRSKHARAIGIGAFWVEGGRRVPYTDMGIDCPYTRRAFFSRLIYNKEPSSSLPHFPFPPAPPCCFFSFLVGS